MRNIIIGLVLLTATAAGNAQHNHSGTSTLIHQHQNWQSNLLMSEQMGVARFSSFSQERYGLLALDYVLPSCSLNLSFVLDMGVTSSVDNIRRDVMISFRADTGRRFDLPGVSSVSMGESMAAVTLEVTKEFPGLIDSLRKGSVLRAKILIGENESAAMYMTYSLHGFTAAQDRALALCLKPATRKMPPSRSNYIDQL